MEIEGGVEGDARDIYGTFESGERKMGSRDRVARETGCVAAEEEAGGKEKEVGSPLLLTRHVSVVSRARDLRLDRLPLIRESGLLMRGEFRDYKYQGYREPRGRLDSK